MRDRERHLRGRDRRLRRHPAGPEHRQLVALDRNRVAVVGLRDIVDADRLGKSKMHRGAVHRRQPRGDLHGADRIRGFHRPHRDDQRAVEAAGPRGLHSRAVHRHVARKRDVAHRHVGGEQRLFERERTAEHEADQIVAPDALDVARLVDQRAVAPHAIARDVGADIEVGGERRNRGIARLRYAEQRARLRIGLAEAQEILRVIMRQDRQIALHVAVGETGGRRIERAGARRETDIEAGVERSRDSRQPHLLLHALSPSATIERTTHRLILSNRHSGLHLISSSYQDEPP